MSKTQYTQFCWADEEDWGDYAKNPEGLEKQLGPWYAMANSKPSKAHIFHESCWTVFSQFLEHDVDLDKLFEVCKNVSSIMRTIKCEQLRMPGITWYQVFDRGVVSEDEVTLSERHTFPLKIPEIQGLLQSRSRPNFPRMLNKSKRKPHFAFDTDCFRRLPLEIRTEIASQLSTSEFLTLRLSSRSMGEVFDNRSFWKSRFIPPRERGFLTSLLKSNQGSDYRDWRLIYRCTAKIHLEDGHLFEFHRQWRHNLWLSERYKMTTEGEKIESNNHLLSEMSWKGDPRKRVPIGDMVQWKGTRTDLCLLCGRGHISLSEAVPLSDTVVSLEVYIFKQRDKAYIAGLGLMKRIIGSRRLILGYRIPCQYTVINLRGKRLMGLNVADGIYGICAIQPIFENGLGRWAGDRNSCNLMYTKLMTDTGIKAISGQFDVSLPP